MTGDWLIIPAIVAMVGFAISIPSALRHDRELARQEREEA